MHVTAITCNNLFDLDAFGGPKITSTAVFSTASMYRTALKTIPNWRSAYESLYEAAFDCISAVRVFDGKLWGAHWDSKAFVSNLHDCVQQHDARVRGHIVGKDVQKQAFKVLFPFFHPQDMQSLCARRLRALFPDFEFDLRRCKWDVVAKQLKRCSTHSNVRYQNVYKWMVHYAPFS